MGFSSPSGNIGCYLSRHHVACDISDISDIGYTPPPKRASCGYDWGRNLDLVKRAHFFWASASVMSSDRVLRYGDAALRRGNERCISRRSGMTCVSLRTGHGFELSRYGADRF